MTRPKLVLGILTFNIMILVLGTGIFYGQHTLPTIPKYPNTLVATDTDWVLNDAQNYRRTITFLTDDRPEEVEAYYIAALENEGWTYDCCRYFHKSPYLTHLVFKQTPDGYLEVTLEIGWGRLSCDYDQPYYGR